jgi:type II secretory pathway predicted ATPase ExeA
MYPLTPEMQIIAYATCMLLFGLLALSVRNRRTAAKSSYAPYASPMFTAVRPMPRNTSAQVSRRTVPPVRASGRLDSTGFEYAPRVKANSNSKAPGNPEKKSAAPLATPSPVVPNPEEVKMDSVSFPFETLDPVTFADLSAFAGPTAVLPFPEHISAPVPVENRTEIEEQIAPEIAFVEPFQIAGENLLMMPLIADEELKQNDVEEMAIDPVALPVAETTEKPAATDALSFFGMPQQAFDVTPDPAYLYFSPSHREALTALKEGIENFRGFMVLVAEPGMGKTTLLHKMMEDLTESARVVFLFQTQCSSRELLCYILNELEVDHAGMDLVIMHRALNQALLEEMLRGRRFVLIVDEAQNLEEPVLETIRLLSDFETTHSKLIQIVLAGQPQLAETLMKPGLVQLRQRISVLASLKALSAAETAEYVEYRLRASGWTGETLFTSDALAQIAELSGGVPRSINNLCFNSLLAAFHRGQETIGAEIVTEVAGKLNLEALVPPPQADLAPQHFAPPTEQIATTELARALVAALAGQAHPNPNGHSAAGGDSKSSIVLTGNLTEKVKSQSWAKRHEYRILVTLERDPVSGLPVADRYYCCSIYMDEPQAAGLKAGKPVRIKIEQD